MEVCAAVGVPHQQMGHPATVGADVAVAVGEVRTTLLAEFGYACLDVSVGVDRRRRAVELSGRVASATVADRVIAAASAAAPEWRPDGRRLAPLRTDDWRTLLPGVTEVWASPFRRILTTELVATDGPVEVLDRVETHALVRTARGTLGWVCRRLGPPVAGPRLRGPRSAVPLPSVARAWLGRPYRLGGTGPGGIDCSGLLLRCFEAAWGVRLPRHSTDQLPADVVGHDERVRAGDTVILRDTAGHSHVGLIVTASRAGQGPVVVHASTTRRSVVAEPLEHLAAEFVDVRFAPMSALLDVHRDAPA